MTWTKRIAPVVAAAAIAAGGVVAPASLAAGSTHWTSKKCKSYEKAFKKKHPHATPAQIKAANKVLKKHGCALRVRGGR
jgi:hypothetical protein